VNGVDHSVSFEQYESISLHYEHKHITTILKGIKEIISKPKKFVINEWALSESTISGEEGRTKIIVQSTHDDNDALGVTYNKYVHFIFSKFLTPSLSLSLTTLKFRK